MSKFNIDEDLYKIIDSYKTKRNDAIKQLNFEKTTKHNSFENPQNDTINTDNTIKVESKDSILMFAHQKSKSVSMLSDISKQNFDPNKSDDETIDEFRKYYMTQTNKDLDFFYNTKKQKEQNKENLNPNIMPFINVMSPKKE